MMRINSPHNTTVVKTCQLTNLLDGPRFFLLVFVFCFAQGVHILGLQLVRKCWHLRLVRQFHPNTLTFRSWEFEVYKLKSHLFLDKKTNSKESKLCAWFQLKRTGAARAGSACSGRPPWSGSPEAACRKHSWWSRCTWHVHAGVDIFTHPRRKELGGTRVP